MLIMCTYTHMHQLHYNIVETIIGIAIYVLILYLQQEQIEILEQENKRLLHFPPLSSSSAKVNILMSSSVVSFYRHSCGHLQLPL